MDAVSEVVTHFNEFIIEFGWLNVVRSLSVPHGGPKTKSRPHPTCQQNVLKPVNVDCRY